MNEVIPNTTDIITICLYKWETSSFLSVLVYAETEKAESSTPANRQIDDRDVWEEHLTPGSAK